ncbi:SDR family NAD(P)-dependent oxidoreductase [Nocardiopsis sp. CA-288880]|uniref:SDR family NAD(P)-dependent oxidoreductase n=1 Tax=Nocardiopsis sp. CA-288880 TaxID=3239995 RepID=UPI003D981A28
MTGAEEVERWIVGRLADVTGRAVEDIDPGETFAAHGIASVELVAMLADLGERIGVTVDETMAYRWPTPARFAVGLTCPDGAGGPSPSAVVPGDGTDDPIVVVGMACRFPGGADTPRAYWRNLVEGVDAVTEIPDARWGGPPDFVPDRPTSGRYSYTRRAAFIDDVAGFDAGLFGLSPQEALRTDPQHRLLMEVVWEALENAGMRPDGLAGGRTGVFAGLMDSGQYTRLGRERHGTEVAADPYIGLGSSPSIAAGRIAHRLDLRGPAVTVDTACSSSLVALHYAAQSLRRGESDTAVVAAASLILHPDAFVQGCAMSMLARDGRCKTFDADADGFAMGEGGGAVVLERMSDALRRGHRIRSVLLGSAVNSDGRSNGLTAPNPVAQTAVIRDALADAGISSQEVAFVEAHGSGTALGDEIELTALREAYGEGRGDAPLWVGAVKTQVGHLLAAAGMAGLIKTVLALEHGVLPPNLHLDTPNGAVDPDGPVRPVPGRLDLPGSARTAGTSSFGWSGTNAHVLLRAPAADVAGRAADTRSERAPSSGPGLLMLSAATSEALSEQAAGLAAHLVGASGEALEDVAMTLDEGRARLAARRALVAADIEDAVGLLSAEPFTSGYVLPQAGHRSRVAYLLPGTGDHYPAMGRSLYETEPVFADAVDRCLEVLQGEGVDLEPLLFADPAREGAGDVFGRITAARSAVPGERDPISRAGLSHPFVFTVETALAALLEDRGVRPSALLGYSLGEYTAACLAGVFTVDDALRIVVRRARLIESVPRGAMLAVAASPNDLDGVLAAACGPLAVAAFNGSAMTVLSGTPEAVGEAERRLAGDGVTAMRVRSDHAFHSSLLDPVRTELAEAVAAVPRSAPGVPIVSNVTGTWLTEEEARSPHYWADHLTRPVRYAQGAAELLNRADVLVEVGPGSVLGTLIRQGGALGPEKTVIGTLGTPGERGAPPTGPGAGERDSLLRALGHLWERGAAEPGHGGAGEFADLPTYPFQRSRYWPEPAGGTAAGDAEPESPGPVTYAPGWTREDARPARDTPTGPGRGRFLVLADPGGVGARLAGELSSPGTTVLTVHPGRAYAREGDRCTIDPADAEHYGRLVAELGAGPGPLSVVHLWSLKGRALLEATAEGADEVLDEAIRYGFDSLLLLSQALGARTAAHGLRLLTVSAGCAEVVGGEVTAPERALVHGFGRSFTHEYRGARWSGLDIDTEADASESAREVLRELQMLDRGDHPSGPGALAARRHGYRWTRSWRPLPGTARSLPAPAALKWRSDGAYLITGGTRGLGLALAGELAHRGVRRLALLGRGPLPAVEDLAEAARADGRLAPTARGVAEITALGAEVVLVSADTGEPEQLREAIREVRRRLGGLHGIVHAAGLPSGGLIQGKTPALSRSVLAPKVAALGPFLELAGPQAADERLELLLFYSSVVGEVGGPGESDYGAANTVLDAFAAAVDDPAGTRVCSVLWGPWRHDAWQAEALAHTPELARAVRDYRARHGIGEAEGSALAAALALEGRSTVMAVGEPLESLCERWTTLSAPPGGEAAEQARGRAGRHPRPQLRQPYVGPRDETERRVAHVWSAFLGIGRIGVHDPFFDLGGNSLVGMSIMRALEEEFRVGMPPAVLFEHPTVAELAARLGGGSADTGPIATRERGRRRRQARVGDSGKRRRGQAT